MHNARGHGPRGTSGPMHCEVMCFHLIIRASIKTNEPEINIVLKMNEWISSCNACPFQVLRPHPSSNNVDHINRNAAVNSKHFFHDNGKDGFILPSKSPIDSATLNVKKTAKKDFNKANRSLLAEATASIMASRISGL